MVLVFAALAALAGAYPVEERSAAQIAADLAAGRTTSEAVTRAYLDRIAAIDAAGPSLHSVIAVNPKALDQARAVDAARKAGRKLAPLAGVPVLLKDNIETADPMATTAGSLALKDNITGRDAPVAARLRVAGMVILGKTNLSEWANIRSSHSISGWSGVGGLVKNPYALDRNTCGSSSGTGAAIAASLAAVGVGTETDGSITCPSALNGLVGLKPTVGLVSRTHIVPISHSQDTAGPMARSVADAALLLTVMAGSDPADPATAPADGKRTDYVAALSGATLKGKRLGVLKYATGLQVEEDALFRRTVEQLKAAGAEIVEITDFHPAPELGEAEDRVLTTELKADLNAYLATTPAAVKTRTLSDVIAFNRTSSREMGLFGQDYFERADRTRGLDDPAYLKARALSQKAMGPDGIDALIARDHLDALIAPSYGPAWRTDIVGGDHDNGAVSSLAAVSGYPHLTLPMGLVRGLPVGLSFVGPAWSEARLLALGAAFEALTQARRPPTYAPSVETGPDAALLAPIP